MLHDPGEELRFPRFGEEQIELLSTYAERVRFAPAENPRPASLRLPRRRMFRDALAAHHPVRAARSDACCEAPRIIMPRGGALPGWVCPHP